ncbi:MAG: OmpA family protein [Bacteroidota bacterium]
MFNLIGGTFFLFVASNVIFEEAFNRFMRYSLVILIIVALLGCVSQKKYDDLLSEKLDLEKDLSDAQDSLETAIAGIGRLRDQVERLKLDTAGLGEYIRKDRKKLNSLKKEYGQLQTYYDNLLNNSGQLSRDLAEQQERLLTLREDLEQTKKLLDERESKVKELEDILAKKDAAVQGLKKRITDALLNFEENDLTVTVKNGKVYVSLAEQLLFGSGSTIIDNKGISALKQLASAIKDQNDINIMVEGHTDDVPISKTSQYLKDNWDLSTLRATSIVRILTGAGIGFDRITAAGRGEFFPVSPNDTAQGRQKNRRTEIIITPNLDEIFEILETN